MDNGTLQLDSWRQPATTAPSNHLHNETINRLLLQAGIGSWSYQRDTKCFHFNRALSSSFGLPDQEILSLAQVLDCIHADERKLVVDSLVTATQDQSFQFRHRVLQEDGSARWFEWTGNLCDENDQLVLGICVDITQQIPVRERVSAEEKGFYAIASGVPGKFGYMSTDYVVRFLSNDYLRVLGLALHDVVGRHTREVFGENMFQKRLAILDRAIAGETVSFEDEVTDVDGNVLYEMVTYQPDIDKSGTVCGVFTLRVDISRRRELEQNLQEVSDDLKRSNSDLEQFAYVASHDLKAPLRAIQVLIEWLSEDLQDCEIGDVRENLGLLSGRTSRLNQLLDDLLNYSRAGQRSEAVVDVDFAELVDEVTELLNPQEKANVVTIGERVAFETDRTALHQVLRNLIGNAIKHHPGPCANIELQAENNDDHLLISVTDDGSGIPAEFAAKIFKMFQTLKPRDEVEGSGMGLAIVERIVRLRGGNIWLDSSDDSNGATFKFTWPITKPIASNN